MIYQMSASGMWVASDDSSEPNFLDIDVFLENVLVERKCPTLPVK